MLIRRNGKLTLNREYESPDLVLQSGWRHRASRLCVSVSCLSHRVVVVLTTQPATKLTHFTYSPITPSVLENLKLPLYFGCIFCVNFNRENWYCEGDKLLNLNVKTSVTFINCGHHSYLKCQDEKFGELRESSIIARHSLLL